MTETSHVHVWIVCSVAFSPSLSRLGASTNVQNKYLLRAISPPWREKTKLNLTIISDIYIWQLHLTFITDIYIWQLHLAFISDIYLWRLYLTFLFDIYIWHFYLTFISDIYLWRLHLTFLFDIYVWHVVPYIFHDCVQNSREKCIEYIFQYCFQKSSEKCIGSPNPLFYRCKFFYYEKQYTFSKNSNETRRIWGRLAAPDFANSGKNICIFLM